MGLAEHFLETDPVVMYESEAWVVAIPSDTWQATLDGIWVHVRRAKIPDYGWKIHVSSTLEDAASVLSIVSEIAFDFGCAFKYLSNGNSFRTLHFKNASRLQSGKFIALYPHSEAITAQLLEKLYNALKLYSGLDILTDRAYKDSTNVYYRWGAFNNSGRINAKGEPEELVPNGLGEMVPDIRLPRFSLPEGIFDPFIEDFSDTSRYLPPKSVSLNQFKIDSVLRFTNAGGRYKGICQLSGAEVVIKEARPNTGFVGEESAIPRLHREISVLEKIGSSVKGLAPSVVKKFTAEGHDYVAIEYVPGTPLSEWIARENPLYSYLYRSPTHTQEYFSRATTIIRNIWINLKKLHDLGLAYGDLSLGNVIIDELDHPRFIDFESCTSVDDTVLGLRTPDFCLRHQNGDLPAKDRDIYAFHCIAIALVLRLTTLAEISDHVLKAVTAELANVLSDIPSWWPDACNFLTESSRRYSACKVPDFVAPSLDTPISRARLREMISSAALECYMPDKNYLFPVSVASREGSFLSFGSGCSGLLRALKIGGSELSKDMLQRYSESVSYALDRKILPTNYDVGIAGVAETCSAIGLSDLSTRIVEIMRRDWVNVSDPSLATGLTGVALTLLREGYVVLAEEVMARAILNADKFKWEKNGLHYGRSGVVAGACQFKSLLKSNVTLSNVLRKIIHEEYGQTVRHPKGYSLSLKGEVDGNRLLPYLSDGTAGLLLALILAHDCDQIDFKLDSEDVVSLSADLGTPFMLEGSLMDGAAGLAIVLEISRRCFPSVEHRIPEPRWERIEKYFLPLKSGVGVLHPRSLKFDLSYSQGSMGILAALLWFDGLADLNISGLYLPPRSGGLCKAEILQ